MPVDDGYFGQCSQSAEVCLLACGLHWIMGSGTDTRCEVLDAVYGVLREHYLAESFNVEPLIRRTLEASIVKIESVNINVCAHDSYRISRSRLRAASHPVPKEQGGYT